MKFSQLPIFRVEDFKDQADWISKLFIQLNPFMQAVNKILNQNLDYDSNIKAITRTFNADNPKTNSLAWPFIDMKPQSVQILSAYKGASRDPVILLFKWSYDATKSLVNLTDMIEVSGTSLSATSGSYEYTLRVTV